MIDELRAAIREFLPLRIDELDFNDPVVVLAGQGWSVSIACPWRLMREGLLLTSIEDSNAEARLRELVGSTVVDVVAQTGARPSSDPVLVLSDEARLEIFSDTDLDPWVVRLPGKTFVGSASDPGASGRRAE